MADLSKVKIGTLTYTLKDAKGREDLTATSASLTAKIDAEVTRATGAEGGLDTRIKALESKGRFLSTWNAETGLPETYPEAGQFVDNKYNYKSGDYYIVNKVVATAANNLMPDGAYITKTGESSYTVPSKAFTGSTLNLGDQFQYDGTKWVHIASATTVAFANIQGDAEDNTNLKGKLDAKLAHKAGKTGAAGDLAYKDSASGSYTPQGSIAEVDVTAVGTITVATLTQNLTSATISVYDNYTPAGTITVNGGNAIKGGSITVTVQDAAALSEATITYESYTPAGSIAAKATDGSFSALKSATFTADDNGVQIGGTVSAPTIALTSATYNVLGSVASAGTIATFTEGAFTAAKLEEGFYTAGSAATWTGATYTAPSLGAAQTATYATEGLTAHIATAAEIEADPDLDNESLVFVAAGTDSAVKAQGTLSAGNVNFGTFDGGSATVIDTTKFSGGSKAADTFDGGAMPTFNNKEVKEVSAATADAPVFTGEKYRIATQSDTALKNVEFTGTAADVKAKKVEYSKQEIASAEFTPEATEITATFHGTENKNLIPSEIKYNQAEQAGATFNAETKKVTPEFTGTPATITVS